MCQHGDDVDCLVERQFGTANAFGLAQTRQAMASQVGHCFIGQPTQRFGFWRTFQEYGDERFSRGAEALIVDL